MAEDEGFDLQSALGAINANSLQKFAIYLPNKDKNEVAVSNIEDWIEAGMKILVDVMGGVTRLPTARGKYRVMEDGKPERIVSEDTVVIYSYVFDADAFRANFEKIKKFVHTFGNDTNQQAVMVEYLGENPDGGFYTRAYYIEEYPAAA